MSRYASETSVSVEKTRAEIERTLGQNGASQFMYATDAGRAVVGFRISGRVIKMILNLPDPQSKEFTLTNHRPPKRRTQADAYKAWEQACRSRWRTLLLVIRAKLEASAIGVTTIESEFLAFTVLPDGRTVMDSIGDDIQHAIESGKTPRALLPMLTEGR